MSPRSLPDIVCKLNYQWTGSVGYRGRLRTPRRDKLGERSVPREGLDLTTREAERCKAGTRLELAHPNAVIPNTVLFRRPSDAN